MQTVDQTLSSFLDDSEYISNNVEYREIVAAFAINRTLYPTLEAQVLRISFTITL